MEAWWGSLVGSLQIFYGIAITTSAVMLIQLVLLFLGLDGDADVDAADGDGGGHILSVRTITAFFTGFGWSGVASLEAGRSLGVTLVISSLVGCAFTAGVFFLMRALSSLRHSGTLDYRNAIGAVGSVYLPIPPTMSGPGKIEVIVQGRLRVVDAFSRAAQRLENQHRVRVVDIMDQNTLVVEPMDQTEAPTSQEG